MDAESSAHPPEKFFYPLRKIPIRVAKIADTTPKSDKSCTSQCNRTKKAVKSTFLKVERNLSSIGSDLVIDVEFSVCNERVKLLIDTGAHASIIAAKHIKSNVLYYPKIRYCLIGINGPNSQIKTLGATYGNVVVSNVKLNHQFQIAGDDIHLEYDGIVGNDFLLKYGANK